MGHDAQSRFKYGCRCGSFPDLLATHEQAVFVGEAVPQAWRDVMKSMILAVALSLAINITGGGAGNAETFKCPKAVSVDACITLNSATPVPKKDRSVANNSCCYGCDQCGANMVNGYCATCSAR
jgi:hypothetical protein